MTSLLKLTGAAGRRTAGASTMTVLAGLILCVPAHAQVQNGPGDGQVEQPVMVEFHGHTVTEAEAAAAQARINAAQAQYNSRPVVDYNALATTSPAQASSATGPDGSLGWVGGTSVMPGTERIVDIHGMCRWINNGNASAVYVPTQSADEWSSFIGTAPPGVGLAACCNETFQYEVQDQGGGSLCVTAWVQNDERRCGQTETITDECGSAPPPPDPPCALPWGGSIPHGATITAWQDGNVPHGNSCFSETRACNAGTLSGSYQNASCTVSPEPVTCPVPASLGGGTLNVGGTVTAWQAASVTAPATCQSQVRTCQADGSLSGSWTAATCHVFGGEIDCLLPWDGLLPHGESVTAWQASSVNAPASCVSETRTCNNGVLSGSYGNQSCSVIPNTTCQPYYDVYYRIGTLAGSPMIDTMERTCGAGEVATAAVVGNNSDYAPNAGSIDSWVASRGGNCVPRPASCDGAF